MTLKAAVLVQYEFDIPMTAEEAAEKHPDALWPVTALAMERVEEIGLQKLIDDSVTPPVIQEMVVQKHD